MRSPIPVAPLDTADEAAEQPTPEDSAPARVAVADPGSIATLRAGRD
jgi:hypothetical protein